MSALSRSSDALVSDAALPPRSSSGSSSNDGDKSPHDSSGGSSSSNGRRLVRSLLLKAACVAGGVFLLKKFTKSATPWDHARVVSDILIGEKDIAEHLTSVYLSRCQRGQQCLYEGSTPPGGYPNAWNGASRCTSELTIYKNGELHCWDRGYDEEGNQVWGVQQGPYEFKPCRLSGSSRPILESDYLSSYSTGSGHMESYE